MTEVLIVWWHDYTDKLNWHCKYICPSVDVECSATYVVNKVIECYVSS